MSHNLAVLCQVEKRGFIREGYAADLVQVDMNSPWQVSKDNIHYKCGWSPMQGTIFQTKVTHTFVNGHLVYENERFHEGVKGVALVKTGTKDHKK